MVLLDVVTHANTKVNGVLSWAIKSSKSVGFVPVNFIELSGDIAVMPFIVNLASEIGSSPVTSNINTSNDSSVESGGNAGGVVLKSHKGAFVLESEGVLGI